MRAGHGAAFRVDVRARVSPRRLMPAVRMREEGAPQGSKPFAFGLAVTATAAAPAHTAPALAATTAVLATLLAIVGGAVCRAV